MDVHPTAMEIWPNNEKAARWHTALLKSVHTGESTEVEFFINAPGAHRTWHQVRFVPERDLRGNVISISSIGHDLTELKLTEEKLRQSEQQFRTLAELPGLHFAL